MKKIISLLILLLLVMSVNGKMISTRIKKLKDGKKLVIEKYINEPDGKCKIERLKNNFYIEQITTYYKNHREYLEKKVQTFQQEKPLKVFRYYTANHESGRTYSIQDYTGSEDIITSYYKNNEDDVNYEILYRNKLGKIYKQEIFYYPNDTYQVKTLVFYKSYENDVYELKELFFENHPQGITQKSNYYEKNHLIKEIQYFNKHPVNQRIAKIVMDYKDGRVIKFQAFDKEGNEFDPDEKSY